MKGPGITNTGGHGALLAMTCDDSAGLPAVIHDVAGNELRVSHVSGVVALMLEANPLLTRIRS